MYASFKNKSIAMKGAENSMDEIDLIARTNVPLDNESIEELSTIPPPYTKEDEKFFGFKGLESEFVYRVCRPDECIKHDIRHKTFTHLQQSRRSIAQHVASGSKNPSMYISTTASLEVASLWAYYEMETVDRRPRDIPRPIIKIELEQLKGTDVEAFCANLTNDTVREHFIKGNTHRCFAKSSKEVLFRDNIPLYRRFDGPYPFSRMVFPWESEYNDSVSFQSLNIRYVYWPIKPPVPEQPPPKKKKKKKKKKHNQQKISEELCFTFAK